MTAHKTKTQIPKTVFHYNSAAAQLRACDPLNGKERQLTYMPIKTFTSVKHPVQGYPLVNVTVISRGSVDFLFLLSARGQL